MEANLQRDKHARLCNSVNQLIDELTPAAPDFQLQEACNQLVSAQFSFFPASLTDNHFRLAHHPHRRPGNALATRFFPWNACDTGSLGRQLFKRGKHETPPHRESGTPFFLDPYLRSVLTRPSLSPKMRDSLKAFV